MLCSYERTQRPLLDIQHVSLSFGSREVLRDVNATITDVVRPDAVAGQVVCFLGPSGIGKTQLSRIICGLQTPTSGTVILDTGVRTRKGLVGFVPQNYPLFEFLTVRGNLAVAGAQSGLIHDLVVSRAEQYVETFGLTDYLDMYPKALSGGTRQRVAIVRQMMCAEHYLVMDEPFSGLDPIMKAKASEAITQLASQDELNTVIVITHDISEGLAVADMVWLLGLEKCQPGARIVEQYDLAAMGFAWHPGIQSDPEFLSFVGVVKERFKTLR